MENKLKCNICGKLPIIVYRNCNEIYCQECNKNYPKDELIQSIVNEIEIGCKNIFCSKNIKIKEYAKHLEECEYEIIECENKKFGCLYSKMRSEYNHECKYDVYKYVESKFEKLYIMMREDNEKIKNLEELSKTLYDMVSKKNDDKTLKLKIEKFDYQSEMNTYCDYCKRLMKELMEDHSLCKDICCHMGNGTGYHHWLKCMCCNISVEMREKIMDAYNRKTTLILN